LVTPTGTKALPLVPVGATDRDYSFCPGPCESPSLVLVINDTKLLIPYVKCFELGISNTCDEGVRGNEWWPQDYKEMVHGHEISIMVEMHII
jgi:hypothetical protein